ncbi:hypothetical protein HaLaN_23508 [Haematococcus lacustris]|uniref:Uncharacterized protein n=1 Tax=Haematococcus lacustris TaxID=44745 RepID=A0A6A0A275_HAELA|nr:hypothetical protein HaLaN_23508 [Haematococcus lacustris]
MLSALQQWGVAGPRGGAQVYQECAALQQEAQQLDLEAAAHG